MTARPSRAAATSRISRSARRFVTPARTITSTDIVNFACLSGDFNEVHTNFEYCKTTPFGEPIAHGPLVYAIMGGLQYASGINDGTLLALLRHRQLAHARAGQARRHHPHACAGGRQEGDSKPDRGVVTFQRQCVKQDGTRGAGDEGDAHVQAPAEDLKN